MNKSEGSHPCSICNREIKEGDLRCPPCRRKTAFVGEFEVPVECVNKDVDIDFGREVIDNVEYLLEWFFKNGEKELEFQHTRRLSFEELQKLHEANVYAQLKKEKKGKVLYCYSYSGTDE